ncbi:MAG: hypothetical protein AAFV53_27685 [Myxococcota bacterium]
MRLLLISVLMTGCVEFSLNSIVAPLEVEPQIAVTPMDIVFGELSVGEQAVERLLIQNLGSAPLDVNTLVLEADNTAFSLLMVEDGQHLPVNLAPAGDADGLDTIEVDVVYTPDSLYDSGMVQVLSSDPDEGVIGVSLFGGVGGPRLEIEPTAADFSEKRLGCDEEVMFTLRNIGSQPLLIDDVFLSEARFEISHPLEVAELLPGESTRVGVFFSPEMAEPYADTLQVFSNDPEGGKSASLSGVGMGDGACEPTLLEQDVQFQLADIAFVVDTTCSMAGFAQELFTDFSDIAGELNESIADITFGVSSYRDYAYHNYGTVSRGDLPFQLEIQQTANLGAVTDALGGLIVDGGSDIPESGLEALYQAATGLGYDQNCDQSYDRATDVPPFLARPDDVFSGTVGGVGSIGGAVGTRGGMGFRADVLPIMIIGTDAIMRDQEAGHGVPDGCVVATAAMVREAMEDLNARVIGVGVRWDTSLASYAQMDSVADLTVTWEPGAQDFTETIVDAVDTLLQGMRFDRVWLEVRSDPDRQIDAITPDMWENVDSGEQVQFVVHTTENTPVMNEAGDNTTRIELELFGQIGGSTTLLSEKVLYVLASE